MRVFYPLIRRLYPYDTGRSQKDEHTGLNGIGLIVGVGETHIDMWGRHTVIPRNFVSGSSITWRTNHGNHASRTIGGKNNRHPLFADSFGKAVDK